MKFKYLLPLFISIIIFLASTYTFAEDSEIIINYPSTNSTSFLYPLKRGWEKVYPYVLFSDKGKVEYQEGLLKERLGELKYVAEKKLLSEIETTSNRFSYQAGITVDQLISLKDKDKINKTLEDFKSYKKTLTTLRDIYPDTSFYRLIQQNIETLDILAGKTRN